MGALLSNTRQAYNWAMKTTPEQRDVIVERLAEIKADPNANPRKPTSEGAKLDSETTQLLCELADENPAKPSGG
jgi:hypothetical protein